MKCILIDDEPDCLELLAHLIHKYCPEIQILGQYHHPGNGIKAIQTLLPDLVFLDVEMPEINGFGVLEACRDIPFQVVFTTAFNEYAVKAFKYSAIGYLLKPVDQEDLSAVVIRALGMLLIHTHQQQRDLLFDLLHPNRPKQEKIALPTSDSIVFLQISDIVFGEAYGNYSKIYIRNQEKPMVSSKKLRELDEILTVNSFYRLHNSYLVNLKLVDRYIKGDVGGAMMCNGKLLPVARQKKDELLELLGRI
jgi:two-component system, LytTR family, response regulator